MKLQNRNLSLGMQGDDVALLIKELGEIDYSIADKEIETRTFGDTTREAVEDFQRNHNLSVTGKVDHRTARAINLAVDSGQQDPQKFVVQGMILDANRRPLPEMLVKVFDRDLRSEQLLGEALTNNQGTYKITYTNSQFRRAEKRSADLLVCALDQGGTRIAESDILFNAPRLATIDLIVERSQRKVVSEFERLVATLTPVLEGIPFADLNEEDITFLAGETTADRRHITFLSHGAIYFRNTRIPTEAFYGWFRKDLPVELNSLLAQPIKGLRAALQAAIDENIVPPVLKESFGRILRRVEQLKLEHGLLVEREVVGILLRMETEEPLSNYTIHAIDLDAEDGPKDLGRDISDQRGLFSFPYITPYPSPQDEEIDIKHGNERRFQLRILNMEGEEIHKTEISITLKEQKPFSVLVPIERLDPGDVALEAVATELDFNIPDVLSSYLKENEIKTLADIRRSGGIARRQDLPVATDDKIVLQLDAQANLTVLSDNLKQNHRLIQNGFNTIGSIAAKTRAEFVTEVHTEIGDFKAAQLHVKSLAQTNLLNNFSTQVRSNHANGFSQTQDDSDEADKCSCEDCDAAVSPLAYLADLLDYALTHVKNDSTAITLDWLAEQFHQPFGDLPASCDEMDKKIRQVRLCIEVLRRFFDAQGLSLPEEDEKAYALSAYMTLLTKIGTSFEETRLARSADQDERDALAIRLGIDTEVNGLNTLNALHLDPNDQGILNEQSLEQLFGLVDTTRNPLSENTQPDLLSWRLRHLRTLWKSQDWPSNPYAADAEPPLPIIDPDLIGPGNPDPGQPDTNDFRNPIPGQPAFDLWQQRRDWVDAKLANLKTDREANDLGFILRQVLGDPLPDLDTLETNLSEGIDLENTRATITEQLFLSVASFQRLMEIKALNDAAEIIAETEWDEVYAILAHAEKLKQRDQWRTEEQAINLIVGPKLFWISIDEPELRKWLATNEDRQVWQQTLRTRSQTPIIDPDLIGPIDLRDPQNGNAAYDLWQVRRDWIDGQLAAVQAFPQDVNGFTQMIGDTIGVSLMELAEQEATGNSIQARLEQLSLVRKGYIQLLRVKTLLDQNQTVIDSEWEDIYSILVQVKKQREFAVWRDQEQSAGLVLGPDDFQIPEPPIPQIPPPEPIPLPAWRAYWKDRRNWQDQLEARIEQEKTIDQALKEAVSATEEETLPRLRDALILAISAGGDTFDEKAKWVTDHLLIDSEADGCLCITRIAQAIETIQVLLWSVRTKQLEDTHPNLELDADNFDDEWKWIGSYETWRSAMFVFLYPENILMPSFRRHSTPAFQEMVKSVRRNRRLTPDDACRAAKEYAEYFRDVCTLTIEVTCQTDTRLYAGDECDNTATGYSPLLHMFGRGEATDKVYWSTYDPYDDSGYGQTFWEAIPNLDNVVGIAGALPYDKGDGQRYIFLFVLIRDKGSKKLIFSKYDLEICKWEVELSEELELPPYNVTKVICVQNRSERSAPTLIIRCNNERQYARQVNKDGNDWMPPPANNESDEWEHFRTSGTYTLHMKQTFAALSGISPLSEFENIYIVGEDEDVYIAQMFPIYSVSFQWVSSVDTLVFTSSTTWIGALRWDDQRILILVEDNGTKKAVLLQEFEPQDVLEYQGDVPFSNNITHFTPSFGYPQKEERQFVFELKGSKAGWYRSKFNLTGSEGFMHTGASRVTPRLSSPTNILESLLDIPQNIRKENRTQRRLGITKAFHDLAGSPASILTYLHEAYYFVPIFLALQLQKRGEYVAALDWFRTVYDYSALPGTRKIYHGLVLEESLEADYQRQANWLLEPLDTHRIAESRQNTYTRFTLQAIVRCFLEYADAEFTRDTVESLARARTLYMTALELLDHDVLQQQLGTCHDLIGVLDIDIGDPHWRLLIGQIKKELIKIGQVSLLKSTITNLQTVFTQSETEVNEDAESWAQRFLNARNIVAEALAKKPVSPTFATVLKRDIQHVARVRAALLSHDEIFRSTEFAGKLVANDFRYAASLVSGHNELTLERRDVEIPWFRSSTSTLHTVTRSRKTSFSSASSVNRETLTRIAAEYPVNAIKNAAKAKSGFIPAPSYQFCVPPNPLIEVLRLHAELNLYKLRSCRNIAGMERQVDPYAAATDTITGLPMIGVGGQLVLPGIATLPPTPYRYTVLIERAKQLVQLAAQIEASMLSSLEKRDAEYYNLLKARQDVQLTRQGVRLQSLRLKEAKDGVRLAELNRDRSQIQIETYTAWIEAELNVYENMMIQAYESSAEYRTIATAFSAAGRAAQAISSASNPFQGFTAGLAAGAYAAEANFTSLAISDETNAQINSIWANFERRKDEWELQKSLAEQDRLIGEKQIDLAENRERIVGQEQLIAKMQSDHAKDTMEYLINKFTNVELYDWMSDILEGVYSVFLQHATAIAKLAENQLAFERQEPPPAFIQADYWEATAGMEVGGDPHSAAPDRRGLTGSARLLQDIHELDLHAFETDKRKLQLTKTFSLARLAPTEFQRFRETGVLLFATPMELFDRDFPGHYHRLIKRVRTSVAALIPPVQGIHTTLSTTGLSKVVIGGSSGLFQSVPLKTLPQSVALTSPINATGVFELTPESQKMLLPFEGMGVDANWELRMPKASNLFDFVTIADVLITFEYTAFNSYDYRQQVIQKLDNRISADLPFSFRHQFPDQWYHLHNPEQTDNPMTVTFRTRRGDFPANFESLKIEHIVLYFARSSVDAFEIPVTHLNFIEEGSATPFGGGATTIDGVISTRRGNAGSWTTAIGKYPVGKWELALPDSLEIKNRFKNEELGDILFVITYKGRIPDWPT